MKGFFAIGRKKEPLDMQVDLKGEGRSPEV
jgi:hypothetical protein